MSQYWQGSIVFVSHREIYKFYIGVILPKEEMQSTVAPTILHTSMYMYNDNNYVQLTELDFFSLPTSA